MDTQRFEQGQIIRRKTPLFPGGKRQRVHIDAVTDSGYSVSYRMGGKIESTAFLTTRTAHERYEVCHG